MKNEHLDETLAQLVDLGVLKAVKTEEKSRYKLRSLEDGRAKDFLVLEMLKRANVSAKGNRAVRVRAKVMALRNGVETRPCGSMIWSNKVRPLSSAWTLPGGSTHSARGTRCDSSLELSTMRRTM